MRSLSSLFAMFAAPALLSTSVAGVIGAGDAPLTPGGAVDAADLAAGRCAGPTSETARVNAYASATWRFCFSGAGQARIRVDGDNDTDLDCFVYDENGREIARDDDETDYCVLNWSNGGRQMVRLRIENLGDVYNRYQLWTN
ncbi:hypothetical protein [Roseisolibacter sp. H3M3-2]|uniref:hypothetical protein n=1 Tax=Roseisolibacter sp. H3M3-2 TaxID=3031323 RepID=UPI0023DC04AF|nr:hypothetical protein [Roseisolibacter sp. H3M3-2]MDF1502434.1 hypothetical protein [Roseisolibacter sp. H3M3-2]